MLRNLNKKSWKITLCYAIKECEKICIQQKGLYHQMEKKE